MTKILVIEDETLLRIEVVEWLTFEGYDAIGAEDGRVGIEYTTRDTPDLIISDITMPRQNGYDVLLEIRANPLTTHIPFIFMTARAAHEDIRQGMILGADDYITKPFTRLELLQAIQARLQKKVAQEYMLQNQIDQLQSALEQEHEQRLMRAKLVAMFSHDFRNQLTVILSSNRLVRDFSHRLDEQRRLNYLNQIELSAKQLLQMLNDMLVVAQMEAGRLEVNLESLDAVEFIGTIVEEFKNIHEATHRLVFQGDSELMMLTDTRLLRQITANLISNAIKYSPRRGEVLIMLDKRDDQCVFSVRDNGIGIPEETQKELFSTFQRGSNVGKIEGTGLGLAIVKQAVDMLQGSIQVESQVGVGTTMIVMLPSNG